MIRIKRKFDSASMSAQKPPKVCTPLQRRMAITHASICIVSPQGLVDIYALEDLDLLRC